MKPDLPFLPLPFHSPPLPHRMVTVETPRQVRLPPPLKASKSQPPPTPKPRLNPKQFVLIAPDAALSPAQDPLQGSLRQRMVGLYREAMLKRLKGDLLDLKSLNKYIEQRGKSLGKLQLQFADKGPVEIDCRELMLNMLRRWQDVLLNEKEYLMEERVEAFEEHLEEVLMESENELPPMRRSGAEDLLCLVVEEQQEAMLARRASKDRASGIIGSIQTDYSEIADQDQKQGQNLDLAGRLEWVLEVDSIYNYKSRIPKIRRDLICDETPEVRQTWHTETLVIKNPGRGRKIKQVVRPRIVPRYFIGRETTEEDKKLYMQLKEWEAQIRDTLRVYPMNIENSKHGIEDQMRNADKAAQGKGLSVTPEAALAVATDSVLKQPVSFQL